VPPTRAQALKYYTFIATETAEPQNRWFFAVEIDEAVFTNTVRNLCGVQVPLDRIDTYLLAITIIHRKAKHLLKPCTAAEKFRFSTFETWEIEKSLGTPGYQAGGLAIWMLPGPLWLTAPRT